MNSFFSLSPNFANKNTQKKANYHDSNYKMTEIYIHDSSKLNSHLHQMKNDRVIVFMRQLIKNECVNCCFTP